MNESIGKRLKEERERIGFTQSQLGDIANKGKTTVISWERGSAFPNADFLQIAAQYGIDTNYIITGQKLENIATTSYELAFLRNCRAFKDNESRQMALNALVAMSGYKSSLDQQGNYAANDHTNLMAAEQTREYIKDKK